MPALSSFEYAVIRIVPRVEREEFINAGVLVFCLSQNYLGARVELNEQRLAALYPGTEITAVRAHLEAIPRICSGDPEADPISSLPIRERFLWLAAPRSTVIQMSPVHSGLCDSPQILLDSLFRRLVTAGEKQK